ncbi:MAG: TIGR04283 family arsenosugar biosynthesis glycosyltransferase [Pacificimonas sp.]
MRPARGPCPLARAETLTISVIIPSLNEAQRIGACVRALGDVEVIVADGGSSDDTVARAEAAGAAVVVERGGRGAQQNAGAATARGNHLLFLHADTLLPDGWVDLVVGALGRLDVALGAFSLGIEGARFGERLIASGANVRSRLFSLPYGDQALFLRRETFDKLGGFRPLPIMEDYDLVCRAQRVGTVETMPQKATTSNRRWRQTGLVRSVAINQLILAGYVFGFSTKRLARFYWDGQSADDRENT